MGIILNLISISKTFVTRYDFRNKTTVKHPVSNVYVGRCTTHFFKLLIPFLALSALEWCLITVDGEMLLQDSLRCKTVTTLVTNKRSLTKVNGLQVSWHCRFAAEPCYNNTYHILMRLKMLNISSCVHVYRISYRVQHRTIWHCWNSGIPEFVIWKIR